MLPFWHPNLWFSKNSREEGRILGCECAYARSHPKMRGLTTEILGEPDLFDACEYRPEGFFKKPCFAHQTFGTVRNINY
jgi:hypothetical protein